MRVLIPFRNHSSGRMREKGAVDSVVMNGPVGSMVASATLVVSFGQGMGIGGGGLLYALKDQGRKGVEKCVKQG